MFTANAFSAGFRIIATRGSKPPTVGALYKHMVERSEVRRKVKYHPEEELFEFEDGSALIFNYETEQARCL